MKLVAVSQRVDNYPDYYERRDAIDQKLNSFLHLSGLHPLPVPNCLSVSHDKNKRKETVLNWLKQVGIQAIVLSGGNNIGNYPERDETENWLLDYAEKLQLPVLGICRGMQVMGVRSDGKLTEVSGHVRTKHKVTGVLSGIMNSYHNFCFTTCPSDYEMLAISTDGCVEAIRHRMLPWEGWMWHPERYNKFKDIDIERVKTILNI